jgi:hypothetical protein
MPCHVKGQIKAGGPILGGRVLARRRIFICRKILVATNIYPAASLIAKGAPPNDNRHHHLEP